MRKLKKIMRTESQKPCHPQKDYAQYDTLLPITFATYTNNSKRQSRVSSASVRLWLAQCGLVSSQHRAHCLFL